MHFASRKMAARAIVIVAMSAMTLLGAMRAFYTDTSTTTDDTHLTAKTTLEREFGLATEFTTPEAPDKKTTQTKAHERYYDPDAAREYVPSTARKPDEYFIYCNRCLLYTSPSPRDRTRSPMPSSA